MEIWKGREKYFLRLSLVTNIPFSVAATPNCSITDQ